MKKVTVEEAVDWFKDHFLNWCWGINIFWYPDYWSLKGIYQGIDQPEYLLSHEAMIYEPQKFYSFVKNSYHPMAKPNMIHLERAKLEINRFGWFPRILMDYMRKWGVRNL